MNDEKDEENIEGKAIEIGSQSMGDFGYTAFEKWTYKQIIYFGDQKTWLDIGSSFYWASRQLVEGVLKGTLREDLEGIAGVHLFRHYLELALKQIVLRGRYLAAEDVLANPDNVKAVANIHDLATLWTWVLEDARPKMELWDNYDTDFGEKCVMEFDAADKKGFAFRYAGQGGERCYFSFGVMLTAMEHVQQVLDGIITYLVETYHQTLDWLDEMRSW